MWLDADATRLSQVVGNLLNNSAKYTPEGGRIEVAARKVEGDAVIEVSDTGIGIPKEKLTEGSISSLNSNTGFSTRKEGSESALLLSNSSSTSTEER